MPSVKADGQPVSIREFWRTWRQRFRGDQEPLLDAFAHLTLPRRPTPENVERRIGRAIVLCDAALFMIWLAWIAPPEVNIQFRLHEVSRARRPIGDVRPSHVVEFVTSLIEDGVDDDDLADISRITIDQCWHREADFRTAVIAYLFRADIYLKPRRQAQEDIRGIMRTADDFSQFVEGAALRERQVEASDPVARLEELFSETPDVRPMVAVLEYRSRVTWVKFVRETLSYYGKTVEGPQEIENFTQLGLLLAAGAITESRQNEPDQAGKSTSKEEKFQQDDQSNAPGLLMSIYIPHERLYAAEQQRVLTLFRDWLIRARKRGIRQSERTTSRGAMFEYYTDDSVSLPDLRTEIDIFANFLKKCAESPAEAIEMLSETEMNGVAATVLVTQFSKEVQRIEVDARHSRERGMLTIRQALESKLLEAGVDLRAVPDFQVGAVLEGFIPSPDSGSAFSPLAGLQVIRASPNANITINQTVYSAMEQTIIGHVQGTVNLGAQAKEILTLIDRFAAKPDIAMLTTAVHELEDPDAPANSRKFAKVKLKDFLSHLSGKAGDVALNVLEKYLESKLGL